MFGASLQIEITPRFLGAPLQMDSLRYETSAGESFSFTRVSYLLSGFALQRPDGSWLELTNQVVWMDVEKERKSVQFDGVPAGTYGSIRFQVGPEPEVNHADIAQYAAEHPLNPNLNNLHWSWQQGFIFLALEGMWRDAGGTLEGWVFHFARDTNRTPVVLAAALDMTRDTSLELDFDVARLLNAPQAISFARDGTSTHSRDGDPIAAALAANLPGAFVVRRVEVPGDAVDVGSATRGSRVRSPQPVGGERATKEPLYLPVKFTPYAFKMKATFPMPDLPKDNPLIEERVALGEKLFNETALSRDNTVACATCHKADAAFSDGRKYSLGVRQQAGTRNAMPLFNLAWKSSFFWDGRAPSLRVQALMPVQDHAEMDESLTNVVAKLGAKAGPHTPAPATRDYAALFAAAFGSAEITPEKIGLALEQYLLTLTSYDSKFDRVMAGKEQLADDEKRGLELFMTEYDPRRGQYGADCFHCHGGPLFQSQTFANNGLDADFTDLGRARITGKDFDRGKFATPSLRNVALTAPYMHDGRFRTLEEVVEHYSTGQKRSATLDPNLAKHPEGGVHLSEADKQALVAFLKTLTDGKYAVK